MISSTKGLVIIIAMQLLNNELKFSNNGDKEEGLSRRIYRVHKCKIVLWACSRYWKLQFYFGSRVGTP